MHGVMFAVTCGDSLADEASLGAKRAHIWHYIEAVTTLVSNVSGQRSEFEEGLCALQVVFNAGENDATVMPDDLENATLALAKPETQCLLTAMKDSPLGALFFFVAVRAGQRLV